MNGHSEARIDQTAQGTGSLGGRVAGVLLVGGAALMFAGGGTPFVTSLGGEVWDLRGADQLAAIAGAPSAWWWANGLILAGTVLTLAGLAAAIPWLRSRGVSDWTTWMAIGVFFVGAALWLGALVGRLSVTFWAAELGAGSPLVAVYEAFDLFQERALDVFMILGLGSLAVVGVVLIRIDLRVLGVALLAVGAIGLGLTVFAERIPAFVYMGTAALGIALLSPHSLSAHPSTGLGWEGGGNE